MPFRLKPLFNSVLFLILQVFVLLQLRWAHLRLRRCCKLLVVLDAGDDLSLTHFPISGLVEMAFCKHVYLA